MFLYALTILVSAFLLFQVEPLIAKIILPWFGGSAAVWTTCLLFFQVVLLVGYVYAHLLVRKVRPARQAVVHILLLAASLAVLPILPAASWKPVGGEEPAWRILLLLSATVGLPFFLLSTTGPLVQGWFARRFEGASPYRLYALSNAGSMLALVTYPVLFEPAFATHQQAVGWSVAYGAFVVLCGVTAWRSRAGAGVAAVEIKDAAPPGVPTYLLWIGLPACASVLLLAITNHLSQNVAAIPFLWVLPLSLYLLSFILCFERAGWYRRYPLLQLLALSLGAMAYALSGDFENISVKVLVPLFSMGLFICCMVCHGELARLKPHPRYLTSFYVMISVGGAAGGLFVGLVAPRLFARYYELQFGFAACALLVYIVLRRDPDGDYQGSWRRPAPLLAGLMVACLMVYLAVQVTQDGRGHRVIARNFYGVLRVSDSEDPADEFAVRKLVHGTIEHGEQYLDPDRRMRPTTYYGTKSGVGLAIREGQSHGPLRVGIIGLGTGTLAAYGRPGDVYRFYEINPLVIRLAESQFSFLKDSRASIEMALGDARLSLERESRRYFDVLALDAFSGDSIPVHLLTREAFALYRTHLKPGGVLAVHVSNKYLNLKPVVRLSADAVGLKGIVIDTEDDESDSAVFGSTWVLLTAREGLFGWPDLAGAAQPLEGQPGLRLWTDDYSNLFGILK